ncbi:putative transposase [Limnospira platensis NIES-39]|nr:putative transposase [Arthrospira platensis NIES-39]BDT14853.1 putative transposase [Arthrospira platensis NIES-39]
MSKTKASQFFHLSRNTINLWLQRKAQTGDFLPKPNHRPGNNHKITDWHKFKAFAQEHGDKTSAQMAQLWDDDISPGTISRALKKIGFTRKQLTATKKVMSNSERSLLLRLNIWSRKGWFTSMKLA